MRNCSRNSGETREEHVHTLELVASQRKEKEKWVPHKIASKTLENQSCIKTQCLTIHILDQSGHKRRSEQT